MDEELIKEKDWNVYPAVLEKDMTLNIIS